MTWYDIGLRHIISGLNFLSIGNEGGKGGETLRLVAIKYINKAGSLSVCLSVTIPACPYYVAASKIVTVPPEFPDTG